MGPYFADLTGKGKRKCIYGQEGIRKSTSITKWQVISSSIRFRKCGRYELELAKQKSEQGAAAVRSKLHGHMQG